MTKQSSVNVKIYNEMIIPSMNTIILCPFDHFDRNGEEYKLEDVDVHIPSSLSGLKSSPNTGNLA